MQTLKFESRDEWLAGRRGKWTGSKSGGLLGGNDYTKEVLCEALEEQKIEYKKSAKKEELESLLSTDVLKDIEAKVFRQKLTDKIPFYELIADRLAIAPSRDITPLELGTQLEGEAIEKFCEATGRKMDTSLVIWTRDDNESIAVSPDGFEGTKVACEAKCLSSARHIMAYLKQEVPDDYEEQIVQYFVVNDELETLFMVFYDPRFIFPQHKLFYLEIKREQVQDKIEKFLERERLVLKEVDEIVNKLTL